AHRSAAEIGNQLEPVLDLPAAAFAGGGLLPAARHLPPEVVLELEAGAGREAARAVGQQLDGELPVEAALGHPAFDRHPVSARNAAAADAAVGTDRELHAFAPARPAASAEAAVGGEARIRVAVDVAHHDQPAVLAQAGTRRTAAPRRPHARAL